MVFVEDDTKSKRPMKRVIQQQLDKESFHGRIMACAQGGATHTEAVVFCKKAFGIDNPKILSSNNVEIREGTVLTDQLYFCRDASKGPSSETFFKPRELKCPGESLIMGNFSLVTRKADDFCTSESLEKVLAQYGSPMKITGPGGKIVALLVSDPDQVAQICSDEEAFQKNKPEKNSPLGIIRGGEDKVGLFLQGTEEANWGIGRRFSLMHFR